MVHQDSVVGDDGSHRLLVVPCALVILVLVLMVTACSTMGDEAGAGESSGGEWPAATAAAQPADGEVAEPVVTEDGRMIQPPGHTGFWFEEEPSDPLEKLVYESQRFVGQPVALEPLGERALLPQWEDMPDPCHPEVIRRMEELGFEVVERGEVGPGQVQCAMVPESIRKVIPLDVRGVIWGTQYQIERIIPEGSSERSEYSRYEHVDSGELAESVGCFSFHRLATVDYSLRATHNNTGGPDGCKGSEIMLQVIVNSIGGEIV